jgi:hypothetical protein
MSPFEREAIQYLGRKVIYTEQLVIATISVIHQSAPYPATNIMGPEQLFTGNRNPESVTGRPVRQ